MFLTSRFPPPATARRLPRWVTLSGLALLLIVGGLLVAGLRYQARGAQADAQRFPPPGQLVDVGGFQLHLHCTGEGSPTVILEALSGGISPYWAWVQPEVAETTQVCAYDRAGRGWSEADPEPVSLARTSRNLHTLLANAGVAGPYVLVGHSIGGVYVRQFAADYPDEVAGLVLLDSSHPDQYERYPEMRAATEDSLRLTALFPTLARLGLFRLYFANGGEIDFQDLPPAAHAQVAAFWSSPALFASQQAEGRAAPAVLTDAQALGSLGALPLAVVSAASQLADGWDTLQAELATLSTNSNHLTVEGANHVSLVFNPEHAAEVSAAILELVSDAQ